VDEKLDQKIIDVLDKSIEKACKTLMEQMKANPDVIGALYNDGKIFCQWVDSRVNLTDIPDTCKESVRDGRCIVCQRSPQLDLGMTPADLLRNIKV
jgi:hypothetical protein